MATVKQDTITSIANKTYLAMVSYFKQNGLSLALSDPVAMEAAIYNIVQDIVNDNY